MGENSRIEWCDHTFNPWVGCQKVSPACNFCYAEEWAKRFGQPHLWGGDRRRTSGANWRQPILWNRKAEDTGRRAKVFRASLADVFDNKVNSRWRDDLWHLISRTPFLDWLLLTKRPQNIQKMLPGSAIGAPEWGDGWPNVWLGTTVENQDEADRRIPHLLSVPCKTRFLSCEPLLGPIDLRDWLTRDWHVTMPPETTPGIDLAITGGESGPKARPLHPDWVRTLRDQCVNAGVPFFFKQWGQWLPSDQPGSGEFMARERRYLDQDGQECHGSLSSNAVVHRIGKTRAGAMLDDREWREMPA